MKIEKNETALGWMGKLKIEIIESGHAYLDHAWRYQNACAPFSRLYFVKDGEGILEIGEKQMVLEPVSDSCGAAVWLPLRILHGKVVFSYQYPDAGWF